MHTRMLVRYLLVISSFILCTSNVLAGFATYSNKWPDDAASVDEKISSPDTAKKSVIALNDNVVADDCAPPNLSQNLLMASDRVDELGRLYLKFGGIFATSQVRHIDNLSTGALTGQYLINNNVTDNYLSWEFGLGTKTNWGRWELDYMYTKDLHYNPNPIFANRPEYLSTGVVMNNTLWLNGYIDFDVESFVYFKPYIGGMLGFVWNQTRTVMSGGVGNGAAQYHSNYGLAWGALLGVRVPFWQRWFGYFDWRYTSQGHARWVDSTGQLQLKGSYMMNTFCLGVQYLLG